MSKDLIIELRELNNKMKELNSRKLEILKVLAKEDNNNIIDVKAL